MTKKPNHTSAATYPVAEGFGWQKGYSLHTSPNDPAVPAAQKKKYPGKGYGFHTGIDLGAIIGSDVIVNKTKIGDTGATGNVTGPHLHFGKFDGGVCKDPSAILVKKKFIMNPGPYGRAKVTDIGYDADNGNYVGVQSGYGKRYVFLHLNSKPTIKVGTKL